MPIITLTTFNTLKRLVSSCTRIIPNICGLMIILLSSIVNNIMVSNIHVPDARIILYDICAPQPMQITLQSIHAHNTNRCPGVRDAERVNSQGNINAHKAQLNANKSSSQIFIVSAHVEVNLFCLCNSSPPHLL